MTEHQTDLRLQKTVTSPAVNAWDTLHPILDDHRNSIRNARSINIIQPINQTVQP
jgi:hypothetical protein